MVKTVTFYKKFCFVHEKSLKQEKKLALTLFHYARQSNKAYLLRPIKILCFVTPAKIQICLT